jgi:hypothetical protein
VGNTKADLDGAGVTFAAGRTSRFATGGGGIRRGSDRTVRSRSRISRAAGAAAAPPPATGSLRRIGLLEVGANAEAVTPGGSSVARGGVGWTGWAGGGGVRWATRRESAKPFVASRVDWMNASRSVWSVRQSGYRELRSFISSRSRMDWRERGRVGTRFTAGMAAS